MWLFKLLFLLALIATWLPAESHAGNIHSPGISIDFEDGEEPEEELEEEEVVV